jgi:hypothetical protein
MTRNAGIGLARLQQFRGIGYHSPKRGLQITMSRLVGVDERARHVVERHVQRRLLQRELLLRALEVGDVGDDGHRAAAVGAPAHDAIDAAVGRAVLERLPARIAQAFDARATMASTSPSP